MRFVKWAVIVVGILAATLSALSVRPAPEKIEYGVTFTKYFADELGIDWIDAYQATLDDLHVRKLRLAAHWPMIEPERDVYDFSDLDYQITEASKRDAEIILGVGRRLPRWPECHTPQWIGYMEWEEQKQEIRQYLTALVTRYKDEPTVRMWQIENEPYLAAFAGHICGPLDEEFLAEEVRLVKQLDPDTPVLLTDSGNLGLWYQPYRLGDAFGTSLYIYFWNPDIGQFKTKWPAAFYRIKANLMHLFGAKPIILIELSAEPWLVEPVTNVDVETQLTRMDRAKFEEIIAYAEHTHFTEQYLWGVEWWWWMKERGHPEFWDYAKTLFKK